MDRATDPCKDPVHGACFAIIEVRAHLLHVSLGPHLHMNMKMRIHLFSLSLYVVTNSLCRLPYLC